MIEFLFGMVGIAVLISMLVQIGIISYEHTTMVIDTRNEVADRLASGGFPSYDADYLSGWDAGADYRNYTQDDERNSGNAYGFLDGLEAAMDLSELQSRVESPFPNDQFLNLNNSTAGGVSEAFGIFRETGRTDEIEILPGIRRLVADIETLVIRHEIYMPWTGNILEGQ